MPSAKVWRIVPWLRRRVGRALTSRLRFKRRRLEHLTPPGRGHESHIRQRMPLLVHRVEAFVRSRLSGALAGDDSQAGVPSIL